ncbi:MAG TPA: hypothetical protein VI876_09435 [Dehalococcoidia bacterium]|nr:hypothetical protein [Dehalococcoidia bacterium]
MLAAVSADDEALRAASGSPAFRSAEVVRVPGERTLDHVTVQLAAAIALRELEAAFGPGRELPLSPEGGSLRTVIFDGTMPAAGATGATLLAEVGEDGLARSVVVRRDVL